MVLESGLSPHVTPALWGLVLEIVKKQGNEDSEFEAPKTLDQGAATTLAAALDPSIANETVGFLQDSAVRPVPHLRCGLKERRIWTSFGR